MSQSDLFLLEKVYLFLLIFARTAGMLFFMPVIGGREIPAQIRFFSAIAFAFLVIPIFWDISIGIPENVIFGTLSLVAELLIGLSFSAAMYLFLSCLLMAGDYMGRLGGLSISAMFDPTTGENVPTLSRFLFLAGVAVFVSLGGMEAFLAGFIDSFQSFGPGQAAFSPDVVHSLVAILGTSMTLVLKIAAPVTVSALAIFLVVGILGRSIPQLNVLAIGFGLNTLLVLAVLFLGLGFSLRCFAESIEPVIRTIFPP